MEINRKKLDVLELVFINGDDENSLDIFASIIVKLVSLMKKPGFNSHTFTKEEIRFLMELIDKIVLKEQQINEED